MPQHDILHGRRRIGTHHAGEAGEVLRQHRVALVRHRRGALLALGEEFLGFQHLGALQMPDLGGEALDRRGDHAECGKIHRVASVISTFGQLTGTSRKVMAWCANSTTRRTISASWVRKAMSSCLVSPWMSSTRATSKVAFFAFAQTVLAPSLGITPSSASASAA